MSDALPIPRHSAADLERLRIALAIPLTAAAMDAMGRAMDQAAAVNAEALATIRGLLDQIRAVDQARGSLAPEDYRPISEQRRSTTVPSLSNAAIQEVDEQLRCLPISRAAALQQHREALMAELVMVLPGLGSWSHHGRRRLPAYTTPLLRG